MGVRIAVAGIVLVVAGAIAALVDVTQTSGPPVRRSVTQTATMSTELPTDPDVIIDFHPSDPNGPPHPAMNGFIRSLFVIPHRSAAMDWGNNRMLLTWGQETDERLRQATVVVLENAYPVRRVQRIR